MVRADEAKPARMEEIEDLCAVGPDGRFITDGIRMDLLSKSCQLLQRLIKILENCLNTTPGDDITYCIGDSRHRYNVNHIDMNFFRFHGCGIELTN